jgi:hypothetical protein
MILPMEFTMTPLSEGDETDRWERSDTKLVPRSTRAQDGLPGQRNPTGAATTGRWAGTGRQRWRRRARQLRPGLSRAATKGGAAAFGMNIVAVQAALLLSFFK